MDNVAQYLAGLENDRDRELALSMHKIICTALPDAEVKLAYGLVGYYQPKALCYFGINKRHVGFYPTNQPMAHFAKEVAPYQTGKGTLQFKKDSAAFPVELIQNIARWQLAQAQK